MDGFDPAVGIVVLAATNRPEVLDPALLRPGRFDRQVTIPLPNVSERAAILAVHSRGKQLAPDVDLKAVARGTPGFSGADLANLVNEAAIVAVRAGREVIRAADLHSLSCSSSRTSPRAAIGKNTFGIDRRKNSAGVLTPAGNTLGKRISSTRMNTIFGWLWVLLAVPAACSKVPRSANRPPATTAPPFVRNSLRSIFAASGRPP